MVDRRPGRLTPDTPQNTDGRAQTRRPQFETSEGERLEADSASDLLDAARAAGVGHDMRGPPGKDAPGSTYVGRVSQRRRQPVQEEPEDDDGPQERQAASDDGVDDGTTGDGDRAQRRGRRDPRGYSRERELTDDERVAMMRGGFFREVLPDLPLKPGFHRVWLTTTNPRDPIGGRLRMGYRLLSHEDLGPGWELHKAISAEYAGLVTINEMVAAEVSESLYQRFAKETGHNMPRERERGIYGRLEAAADANKQRGAKLIYDEGEDNAFLQMRGFVPAPDHFD